MESHIRNVWRYIYNLYTLGITTVMLDNLAAETCAYMNLVHPQYSILAARIAVNNLHKETSESFAKVVETLHNFKVKIPRQFNRINMADQLHLLLMMSTL